MTRTTVASALTTFLLVGAEAVVVVVVMALVQGGRSGAGPGLWLGLLAAAAATVPLWRWLHPRVQEAFDHHEEPYQALVSVAPERSAASTIARAVGLPHVVVELRGEVVEHGRPVAAAITVREPIVFDDEVLGEVRAGGRRAGSGLTAGDRQLVRDLAAQLAVISVAREAAERLAGSRTEIVTAREEERSRLRRDLHDGLGPSLASVQLQLGALQRRLPEAESDGLGELVEDVRRISGDLRRVVYELRPPHLDELGFAGALARQVAGVSDPVVTLDVSPERLPSAVEVALFRVASEAVHNALKHSRGTRVRVRLAVEPPVALLEVGDDGRGLGDHAVPGVGLRSMRERCEELGGILEVVPGDGTLVRATIPLGREQG